MLADHTPGGAAPQRRHPAQRDHQGAARRGPGRPRRRPAGGRRPRRAGRARAGVRPGPGGAEVRVRPPVRGPHWPWGRPAVRGGVDHGGQPLGAGDRDRDAAQHPVPAHRQRGAAGAAPFSITGQCNAMGTREAGFTASMPGYGPTTIPAARRAGRPVGRRQGRLPAERGRAYPDIVNGVIDGRIKGLWIIATNPVVSFPNRELLSTPSAGSTCWWCRTGSRPPPPRWPTWCCPPPSGARRTGPSPTPSAGCPGCAPVDPPGEARSDFDIVLALAERLGVRTSCSRAGPARRRLRRVAAGLGRPAVRLQRHHLRADRRRRRGAVAVPVR